MIMTWRLTLNRIPPATNADSRRRPATLRGISLMETMVVIGIMMFLLLIITQIFALNYDIFAKQSKRSDNEIGAILTAKTISQIARGAESIEAAHTFNSTVRTSSSAELVLKLPSVDASNNVIASSYDYVAFYRSSSTPTNIMVVTEAAAGSARIAGTRLITAHNAVLTFRYNNPTITDASRVSLYLVNTQSQRGLTMTTKAWTSIFLRNK
jgi:hypothetical protein